MVGSLEEGGWATLLKSSIGNKIVADSADAEHSLALVGSLATVTPEGRPKVRSVVLRGFLVPKQGEGIVEGVKAGNNIDSMPIFSTHLNTQKISELQANSACEVSFWIEETLEQFRIGGHIHILRMPKASEEEIDVDEGFLKFPIEYIRMSRVGDKDPLDIEGFTGDKETILKKTYEEHSHYLKKWFSTQAPGSSLDEEKSEVEGLDNYCLMVLKADHVDYLNMCKSGHFRRIFTLEDGDWKIEKVEP
ncbi:hypothetical protein AYI68_g7956 [Smittium mucronatum]|uniref:Pyridoxamine 5'-phosphate oxidase Alr4036 family FMN-binding domain-containing protein n=1 Tax=Smittium mucronatum TaxID=133383 RepID=A0A1R0GM77_9FUNG|nr:hypothetical protein AYI68_g7956 [Smittium mucronatum]